MKLIKNWKRVYESDLEIIVSELKDALVRPALVLLDGPVGAGKTTFTKSFATTGNVMSPTYSIINENGRIAHADLYRIKSKEELIHLEIPLYLEDKDFFLVEWGTPYLKELKREIEDDYKIYRLDISVNDKIEDQNIPSSRNYSIYELEN